jgi:hypothetical protein
MNGLKGFVNSPGFNEAFIEMINGRISQVQRLLEQSMRVEEIYRAQGQITALRKLLTLKDDINALEK